MLNCKAENTLPCYTYDDDNRVKTVTNGDVTETYSYAHEADYLENQALLCAMDLYNNELGRQVALAYPDKTNDFYAGIIFDLVEGGDAFVIAWD